jgi:predicted ABC-type transport system involved in lysophospholipase L1 biosynthesis ATPase subunit
MVTHDNSLAPRFSRHLLIQDGEIIPDGRASAKRRRM